MVNEGIKLRLSLCSIREYKAVNVASFDQFLTANKSYDLLKNSGMHSGGQKVLVPIQLGSLAFSLCPLYRRIGSGIWPMQYLMKTGNIFQNNVFYIMYWVGSR